MTRDEVLRNLAVARAGFDERVAAVPPDRMLEPLPGSSHSVRDVLVHISAYEQLIVERLLAARHGATTEFDRDRVGWQAFNDRIWSEAADIPPARAAQRARDSFEALLHEVGKLSDDELNGRVGSTASLDPAWLGGKAPWQLIAIDAYEHYPMHYAALDAAAAQGE
jgi:hypothetical protein